MATLAEREAAVLGVARQNRDARLVTIATAPDAFAQRDRWLRPREHSRDVFFWGQDSFRVRYDERSEVATNGLL